MSTAAFGRSRETKGNPPWCGKDAADAERKKRIFGGRKRKEKRGAEKGRLNVATSGNREWGPLNGDPVSEHGVKW